MVTLFDKNTQDELVQSTFPHNRSIPVPLEPFSPRFLKRPGFFISLALYTTSASMGIAGSFSIRFQENQTMCSTATQMRRRVQRGAAFLDEEHGPKWHEKIRLESLNVGDPTCCILGQLIGGYAAGLKRMKITDQRSCSYGFHVHGTGDPLAGNYARNWKMLTRLWKQLITERFRQTSQAF
jgi:hypothetical protein